MTTDDIIVEIIEAIAKSDGVDPSELDFTLADYIDTDVLETLGDMNDGVWEFTFRVSDHQVQVTHDGAIIVDGVNHAPDTMMQE